MEVKAAKTVRDPKRMSSRMSCPRAKMSLRMRRSPSECPADRLCTATDRTANECFSQEEA